MPEELRFHQDYILKESIILPDLAISTQDSYIGYNAEATELIKKQLLQKRGVEIASATREGDTLKVVVKDLWSTGISLYTLEYRQQGADGWTTVKIENGSTEAQIKGIGDGKYEVRVCAVLDTTGIEDKSFYIAPIYAGEYSDTVTV